MEAEKFEEKVRETLHRREIKPSDESWESLRARLEKQENKSRPYGQWTAIAAVLAAGIFGITELYETGVKGSQPVIVEESAPVEEESLKQEPAVKTVVSGDQSGAKKADREKAVSAIRSRGLVMSLPGYKGIQTGSLALTPYETPEKPAPQTQVTDVEIDALLSSAMAELKQEHTEYLAQTREAEKLLETVEYELEQSFRHKVFEVLKEGFAKAKTAVANRNH